MTLTDHKFVQKLISDLAFHHINKIVSFDSKYCNKVKKELDKTKKILTDLMMIRQMVAEIHPDSGIPKNSNISRELWLKYHIENYFLRIITYKDQVMKVMDTIYRWETKSGNGYEKRLIKKANEDGIHQISNLISNINMLLSSARDIRNKLSHEGSLENPDITLLEIHKGIEDIIDDYPSLELKKEDYLNSDVFLPYFNVTVMNNLKEMMRIEEDLATNFFENLDFLHEKYLELIPENHPLR
jgi:hypothetical protein